MKWFYELKIGTKLVSSFVLVALIAGVIGYVGYKNASEFNDNGTFLYEKMAVPLGDLAVMQEYYHRQRYNMAVMIMANDSKIIEDKISRMKMFGEKFDKAAAHYSTTFLDEYDQRRFEKLMSVEKQFTQLQDELATLARANQDTEAWALLEGKLIEVGRDVANQMDALTKGKIEGAQTQNDQNRLLAKAALREMLLLSGFGILLALGLGYCISRIISRPLQNIASAAEAIASGDTSAQITTSASNDEIGILSRSIKKMVSTIVDKAVWYEGMLDAVPFPISATDLDMNWTFINRPLEQMLNVKREDVIGKQCNNWNTEVCKTETCPFARLRANKPETVFENHGVSLQANAAYLLNSNQEKIGQIEIVQDISAVRDIMCYLEESTRTILGEMEKFADGDMTVSVVAKKDDDIGRLFNGFNKAVYNIGGMLGKVEEAVSATASASSQISSSTEEMAAGAQEQTQQATEVAGAVEEMTKTIVDTTRNAGSAAEIAKQAGDTAKIGGQVVEETIAGMNRIADVVQKSAETVEALGKSSDQIGEIVQVIDDIADQTNLLALNAAIEAARAGEQGRGFAVVADEVRKLAERTTKATKEIAGMIRQIQKDTSGAVDSMTLGKREVEEGKHLAAKAGESLKEIIAGATKVVDTITQVAAASEEQSSASEQISKNIEAISSVTQETAAGTQQIARAAEDLNRLTTTLQDLLGKFSLSKENTSNRLLDEHRSVALRGKNKQLPR